MKKLRDDFRVCGSNYEEFKKEVKDFADITHAVTLNSAGITSLSVCDIPEFETPETQAFYVLSNANLETYMDGGKLKVGKVLLEQLGDEGLLNELKRTTNLCLLIDKDKYIVSDKALLTLTARAGVSGDATFARQNLLRNMHLADTLQRGGKTTIVYREEEGVKKAFAVMGSVYKYIPQTIITEIADLINKEGTLGEFKSFAWAIDHSFTELAVKFPEAGEDLETTYGIKDKTPGLIIETSDIGCCSITVKSCLCTKRGFVLMDEVKFQHSPTNTPEKVMDSVNRNIFDKIRKLPECLMNLMGKALSYEEALIAVDKAMDIVPKKLLSGANRKNLVGLIKAEFDPSISYTMYDIADKFMELPDRVSGLSKVTVTDLKKICGKIPYDLEKITIKEEEEVVLI